MSPKNNPPIIAVQQGVRVCGAERVGLGQALQKRSIFLVRSCLFLLEIIGLLIAEYLGNACGKNFADKQ